MICWKYLFFVSNGIGTACSSNTAKCYVVGKKCYILWEKELFEARKAEISSITDRMYISKNDVTFNIF